MKAIIKKNYSKRALIFLFVFTFLFLALGVSSQGVYAPSACIISEINSQRIYSGTDLSCFSPCYFEENPDCGVCCMLNIIYRITDWLFFILIAMSVLFVLIAGFLFLTSGGNPDRTLAARNYIIYAIVGIAVALMARAVPGIVKAIMGVV